MPTVALLESQSSHGEAVWGKELEDHGTAMTTAG